MPNYRDQDTLIDIAAAARRALRFIQGMDRDAFLADEKTQSAVIHQLLIIGEATKRLTDAFKNGHPEFPWADIARMRDKMVHHYQGIDLEQVWNAVREDVPPLLAFAEGLLPEAEP